jgi:hypothetical protein
LLQDEEEDGQARSNNETNKIEKKLVYEFIAVFLLV